MNTGKLNRRITIVTHGALTPTTIGGFTEAAGTTKTTWCSAKQLTMAESLSYGLETSIATYRFMFHYYSADDVTRIKELTFEGRNFRIVSVENVDELKNVVTIIANERK